MNTSPRFDRRWWYGLPLALLALMLVFEPSALDFAFSDLFYVQGQGFIGRHNDFLEDVLHDRAKQLVIVIGVLAIAGSCSACCRRACAHCAAPWVIWYWPWDYRQASSRH